MTTQAAGRLRAPFPAEHVGRLPKITCRACSKAQGRCCQDHKKAECAACGNWITERHIDIDYVGHGAVTDRLLEVDPAWEWEPLAWEGEPWRSLPAFVYDKDGNPITLWITLTVLGVRRLGVGTCDAGQFDPEKVLIGDALRNAAMRFGVALDLWIKGHAEDDERTTSGRTAAPAAQQQAQPAAQPEPITEATFHELARALGALPQAQRDAIAETWHDIGLPEHDGKPAVRLLTQLHEPVVRGMIGAAVRAAAVAQDAAGPAGAPEAAAGQPADAQAPETGGQPEPDHAPNGDEVRRAEIAAEVAGLPVADLKAELGRLRDEGHTDAPTTTAAGRKWLTEHRTNLLAVTHD